jgi:TonB family protein
MSGNGDNGAANATFRRFSMTGACSLLLHGAVVVGLFLGASVEKPRPTSYQVTVRHRPPVEESKPVVETPPPVEKKAKTPEVVDLTGISAPISLQAAEDLAAQVADADIGETPVPLAENAVITPEGGLGSGADADMGGGNALFGGPGTGVGWGGGNSPGAGGGTGGGLGSGDGNSRGREGASGSGTGGYFAGMPGIIPPGYARTPDPPYPSEARTRGEQGKVILKVEVLTNGNVGLAEVSESSGYESLDRSALEAVRRWRFKPAMKGRDTVICWVNIPIKFEIKRNRL